MDLKFSDITQLVSLIALITGGVFALKKYSEQIRFTRLQNLSALLKKFTENDELMNLFIALDKDDTDSIANANYRTKLALLALIEEVTLYVNAFQVDKDNAYYLFHWHFYFVYQSKTTSTAFWANIGGENEMKSLSWSKSRKLSSDFIPPDYIGK